VISTVIRDFSQGALAARVLLIVQGERQPNPASWGGQAGAIPAKMVAAVAARDNPESSGTPLLGAALTCTRGS